MTTNRVTSTEHKQRFGDVRREALRGPATITHHGRDDVVLLSREHYAGLRAAPPAVPVTAVEAIRTVDLGADVLESLREDAVPEATRAYGDELDEPDHAS